MSQLQVCLSPGLLHLYNLENKLVVVTDVLRATSTMLAAIDIGVESIIPVASRDEARTYLNKENTFVAG